jgi:hypothetical protein
VAYSRLTPVLVGAAQEAAVEATKLRAANAALEGRVSELERALLDANTRAATQAVQFSEVLEAFSSRLKALEVA